MADAKTTYTQAEVDELVSTAKQEAHAEGVMRAAEFLTDRAADMEEFDKDRGHFEIEISVLRWAGIRVGQL